MKFSVTIVLDEGCAHLEDAVSEFAPVLVFRRAGGFRSESKIAASELLKLLTDRSLLGRAIYVAPSFAGFTALLLANEHRDSLVGILLLDPSHPRQGPEAVRILAGAPAGPELERLRAFLAGFGPVWEQSCHEASQVRDLGDVALHVMAGGRFDLIRELPEEFMVRLVHSRHSMLVEYCKLSSQASFEVVRTAGHDLVHQAPEVVLSAIKRMLAVDRAPSDV